MVKADAWKGKKEILRVRVCHKPRPSNEWSEADKQVMGYKGAEYSSFGLKRDAEKYLKSKKNSKDGDGDHNTHNNP